MPKLSYPNLSQMHTLDLMSLCKCSGPIVFITHNRRCFAYGSHDFEYNLKNARYAIANFGIKLVNFSYTMYQNEIIHVNTAVHCVTKGAHLVLEASLSLSLSLTYFVPSLCLWSHNARYIWNIMTTLCWNIQIHMYIWYVPILKSVL